MADIITEWVRTHALQVEPELKRTFFVEGLRLVCQETDFGIVQHEWRFRLGVGFCKPEEAAYYSQIPSVAKLLSSWTPRNSFNAIETVLVWGNPDRI